MSIVITVLDGQFINPGDISWNEIEKLGSSFNLYPNTKSEETVERAKDAQIILTNKVVFDRDVLSQLPKLKMICVMATGYNVIDLEACNEMGIHVANVPAYSTPFVAQHTFALILEVMNNVGRTSQKVRQGEWQKKGLWSYSESTLTELSGKKLGIIGMGNIGKKVAEIGRAFDMDIIYYSRNQKPALGFTHLSMDEVIKNADVLSLHIQLTQENKHMINTSRLKMMKKSAILINTGRGDLINEHDLAVHLSEGGIAGAGLDVLVNEPPEKNNPLTPLGNCVITPHQAWLSIEARTRLMSTLKKNIYNFLGGKPVNIVNYPKPN